MTSRQKQRAIDEKNWWKVLHYAAKSGDVRLFWHKYSLYLRWSNVISPQRQTILKMAEKTVELLSTDKENQDG